MARSTAGSSVHTYIAQRVDGMLSAFEKSTRRHGYCDRALASYRWRDLLRTRGAIFHSCTAGDKNSGED